MTDKRISNRNIWLFIQPGKYRDTIRGLLAWRSNLEVFSSPAGVHKYLGEPGIEPPKVIILEENFFGLDNALDEWSFLFNSDVKVVVLVDRQHAANLPRLAGFDLVLPKDVTARKLLQTIDKYLHKDNETIQDVPEFSARYQPSIKLMVR